MQIAQILQLLASNQAGYHSQNNQGNVNAALRNNIYVPPQAIPNRTTSSIINITPIQQQKGMTLLALLQQISHRQQNRRTYQASTNSQSPSLLIPISNIQNNHNIPFQPQHFNHNRNDSPSSFNTISTTTSLNPASTTSVSSLSVSQPIKSSNPNGFIIASNNDNNSSCPNVQSRSMYGSGNNHRLPSAKNAGNSKFIDVNATTSTNDHEQIDSISDHNILDNDDMEIVEILAGMKDKILKNRENQQKQRKLSKQTKVQTLIDLMKNNITDGNRNSVDDSLQIISESLQRTNDEGMHQIHERKEINSEKSDNLSGSHLIINNATLQISDDTHNKMSKYSNDMEIDDAAIVDDDDDSDYDFNQDIHDHVILESDEDDADINIHLDLMPSAPASKLTDKLEQDETEKFPIKSERTSYSHSENDHKLTTSPPSLPPPPLIPISPTTNSIQFPNISSLPMIDIRENRDILKNDSVSNTRTKSKEVIKRSHVKYICDYDGCNYSTPNQAHLRKHSRTHTNERPFACSKCGKSFKQKSNLKTHILIHSGLRPYQCNICYKNFTQRSSLVQHQKIHSGEKPFICPYPECNKRFKRKDHLKSHYRVHTGEKPEKCTFNGCNKSFATPQQLKLHFMDHTGIRPFECKYPGCDKKFKTNSLLTRHRITHSSIKPFICIKCNKGFSRKIHFNKHKCAKNMRNPQKIMKTANINLIGNDNKNMFGDA